MHKKHHLVKYFQKVGDCQIIFVPLPQKEIPGLTGFGETNLKDMRTFYEEWSPMVNRRPAADEMDVINENQLLTEIRQPLAGEIDWTDFLRVPFSHHMEIINKCKTLDERIFYIHQCATRAWSKYALRDFIAQGLYKDRGNLPSNFTEAIQDYTKPMGVATFRLGEDAPEEYNRILPDTKGLNALIQEDE